MTEARAGARASRAGDRALTLSCVILTMGDRPAEVNRAIDSVLAQRGPQVELVVVGNGADVTGLPAGGRTVRLLRTLGARPAGTPGPKRRAGTGWRCSARRDRIRAPGPRATHA